MISSVRVEFDRVCCEYPPYFKPRIYQAVDNGPLHLDIWQSFSVDSRNIAHEACAMFLEYKETNNTEEPLSGLVLNCQHCPGICHGGCAPVSSETCQLLLHLMHVRFSGVVLLNTNRSPFLSVFCCVGNICTLSLFILEISEIYITYSYSCIWLCICLIYLGCIFHISPITLCDTKKLWCRY